ncbi:uncharacterized protein LOC126549170 [Aphis gossypii]|uniref:uncharacterized protein LOC126549170 n=1 Tax=Aphis gossypii TaxID=80765 RepID=UPI0021591966|nr:uncharacterized protein LOC126549170 [Aphis gossypii]
MMKTFLLVNLIVCVIFVNSDKGKPLSLPQLPYGVYRYNFKGILRCNPTRSNNKLIYEFYLSKKSANTTEIKGNITNLVPFDDSLDLEFNLAVKDSIGGWKENAFLYKSPKACSTLKKFLGSAWITFMDSLGIKNASCPFPKGFFKLAGIDTDTFKNTEFPKSFFYGTYKFRVMYTKNNEVYACFTFVIEVKRTWETE